MILLVADLQELKANPKRAAIGTIVEAELDKGRGPVATALVQTGTLKVGDIIVVGETYGRVRALENDNGKRVTQGRSVERRRRPRPVRGAAGGRHPARRRRREGRPDDGREPQGRGRREGGRGQRPGDARGPLPPDPGRPDQGAADHPQGRRVGLARRDHPRARAARPGRGPDQRPPRGRRRHHRQRHHAGVGVERDRRRLQHQDHRHRPPGRRGRGRRRPPVRHHLQADRRHRGRPQGPARAGDRRGRRGSRRGPPGLPRRQEHGHRRLVRDRRPDRPRRNARVWRGGKVIATDRIESLRRFRDDVREVQQNYECGIGLANFHDLEEGDIIECFTSQTVSRVAG